MHTRNGNFHYLLISALFLSTQAGKGLPGVACRRKYGNTPSAGTFTIDEFYLYMWRGVENDFPLRVLSHHIASGSVSLVAGCRC